MNKTRLASMILIGAGLCLLLAARGWTQGMAHCDSVLTPCNSGIYPQSDGSCCFPIPTSAAVTGHAAGYLCTPGTVLQDPQTQCGVTTTATIILPLGLVCPPPSLSDAGTFPVGNCGGNVYTPLCQ